MNQELTCYSLFCSFVATSEEQLKKHEEEHPLNWTPDVRYKND